MSDLLARLGVDAPAYVDDAPPARPPVRALSLAVAQKCNLGCTYCYAEGGSFGGAAKSMELETALASVDLLFSDVGAGERVNLAFLGGEPLLNRSVIRAATRARAGDRRRARRPRDVLDHDQRDAAHRRRRRLLRGARLRGHRQPRRARRRQRPAAAVSQRARKLRPHHRARQAAARAPAPDAGLRARHRHAVEPRARADARHVRRAGLSQRRVLAAAALADRRG